jgi:hypothetical protein
MLIQSWLSIIYLSFIIVGSILAFFTLGSNNKNSLNANIAAFSSIAMGILLLGAYMVKELQKYTEINMLILMTNIGPFIPLLWVLGISLYNLITYSDKIIEGQISKNYTTYNYISLILILIQSMIIIYSINDKSFVVSGKINKINSMFIYLIGLLNIIVSIIISTILRYFTTDGFK